jgi:CRISPR/Cas system-associated protein Cas10 (large subunit of type III CRISPR-Cas system)
METALDAAEELRQKFAQRFTDWLNEDSNGQRKLNEAGLEPPTLSASLIYAHHQVPLGALIHRGHTLLTDKAKKEAGRNALAVEVRTRGGPTLTFAHRWEDQAGVCLKARIEEVVRLLREKGVASRFLYRMREEAGLLGPRGPLAKVELEQRKAYVASLAEKTRLAEPTEAQLVAEKVLALCEHSGRDRFTTDPLILARFLATGGREER